MFTIIEGAEESSIQSMLGHELMVFTQGYIFTGILHSTNESCLMLKPAKLLNDNEEPNVNEYMALNHTFIQFSQIQAFTTL